MIQCRIIATVRIEKTKAGEQIFHFELEGKRKKRARVRMIGE